MFGAIQEGLPTGCQILQSCMEIGNAMQRSFLTYIFEIDFVQTMNGNVPMLQSFESHT